MLTIEFYPDGGDGPVREYLEHPRARGERQDVENHRREVNVMGRKEKKGGLDRYMDKVFKEDPKLQLAYLAELAQEPINTQLAVLRHRLGLTQEEVARRMHLRQSHVSRLERKDENPTAKMIARAAKALGCRMLLIPEAELAQFLAA